MAAKSVQEEVNRYFRIRKTLAEMLRDRGYAVSQDDLEMTQVKFQELFGHELAAAAAAGESRDLVFLRMLAPKANNASEKIYVFFPTEESLGISTLRNYHQTMTAQGVSNAVIVYRSKITSFSLKVRRGWSPVNFIGFCSSEPGW